MEKFEHFPGVLCTKVGLAKELKGKQMARTKPSQCSLQSAGSLAKNRLVPVQHSPTPSASRVQADKLSGSVHVGLAHFLFRALGYGNRVMEV